MSAGASKLGRMTGLGPQITYLLSDPTARRNLSALVRLLAVLSGLILVYAVVFQIIMAYEGKAHSVFTALYWVLTVMSTLGFGDITFASDLGRAFSIVVLLTGIVMLLIVFPFSFIRYFYAPWIDAQVRRRAPRMVPSATEGHVIICHDDPLARRLIARLGELDVPCFLIEPNPEVASQLHLDGVSVVCGELDDVETYHALHADKARLVLANLDDATNTSVVLTLREHFPDLQVASLVEQYASISILQIAGATHVLSLKRELGDQLASRVRAGHPHANIESHIKDLVIAEFPVQRTALVGRTIRDTRLREVTGLNIVGCWEQGALVPARPDTVLNENTIMLVAGTADQVTYLDAMFVIYDQVDSPVLVIGGGTVGRATLRALRKRNVTVHVVERDESLRGQLEELADRVFVSDAASRDVLSEAGVNVADSAVITTHDDATNVYLAVLLRDMNPDLRIICRITHARNVEASHRAGADYALSHGAIGLKSVVSLLHDMQLVVIGELSEGRIGSVGLFMASIPASLVGKTLVESGIGARTGLSVVAVQDEDEITTRVTGSTELRAGCDLIMLGTPEQQRQFADLFQD